jgi:hypothetical protein
VDIAVLTLVLLLLPTFGLPLLRFLRKNPYLLIICYLLLGTSYLRDPERIFGIINLGVHEFKIMQGLTLFSKDIFFLVGILFVLFSSRKRQLQEGLFFEKAVRFFIILLSINFIIKISGVFYDFDYNSIKSILRTFSPVGLYYVIYYLFTKQDLKYLLRSSYYIIPITAIVFLFIVAGYLPRMEVDNGNISQLSYAGEQVARYNIPHGYALFIFFFLVLGFVFVKTKSKLKIQSVLVLLLLIVAGIISTFRAYTICLLIGFFVAAALTLFQGKRGINIILAICGVMLVYLLLPVLSSMIGLDIKGFAVYRLFSAYEDIAGSTGTAAPRIMVTNLMIQELQTFTRYLLLGKIFTLNFFDLTGANNDIGIVSTVMQAGIFVLIPIVMIYRKVFQLIFIRFSDPQLEMMRIGAVSFFIGIFSSMLFSLDFWFQPYLSQITFTLMGIFDFLYYEVMLKDKLTQKNADEINIEPALIKPPVIAGP